jgi:hypothetical protein
MSCTVSEVDVDGVAPGDVYEFAVLTGGSAGGVEGDLFKARSATK